MEMNTIVSDAGTLVDIQNVSVNKELSRDERIAEFVQQIKNYILNVKLPVTSLCFILLSFPSIRGCVMIP